MSHVEVVQNGLVIVKPDPRLRRAIQTAQQFLSKVGKRLPGLRSLVRHEMMLQWLHRQLHDFAERQKYRGKAVYVVLDEKVLAGALGRPAGLAKDLVKLVKDNAKSFLPVQSLETGIRDAFSIIDREKIKGERKRRIKRRTG